MPPEIPVRVDVFALADVLPQITAANEMSDAVNRRPAPRLIGAQLATYGATVTPMSAWGGPVRLAAGALKTPDDVNDVKLLRDHDPSRVIGAMTEVTANEAGPYGTFRLARTAAADEAFLLAEDGILDAVSAGYRVHNAAYVIEDDEEILEVTEASLFEVSLVGRPADSTARIDAITARKAQPMPNAPVPAPAAPVMLAEEHTFTAVQVEQIADVMAARMAPPAAAPIAAPIGRMQIVNADGVPVVLASERRNSAIPTVMGKNGKPYTAGDFFSTFARGTREGDWTPHQEIKAALADELTTDVPGLLPTSIIGELLARASGRRPVWESLSPRDMPMSGAKFQRPKITQHVQVGARGAEKTNPPSRKFLVTLEDVAKATFAGALDVSNEAIDWTSPSLLNELIIDFTRMYAGYTDEYASTELVAAATAGAQTVVWDGTAATLNKALADAAVLVANGVGTEVDAFPNTVWVSLDVWASLAGLTDTTNRPLMPRIGPMNAMGQIDLTDPTSGPSGTGFRWVVGRRLPAGTFIMGDRAFTESYENGRRFLQAQNVPMLGLDIAYMGYGATYFPYNKTLVAIGPATPPAAAATTTK